MSSKKREKELNEEKVLNYVYPKQEKLSLNSEMNLKGLQNQITQNFSLTLINIPLTKNNRKIFGLNLYSKVDKFQKFSLEKKNKKVNFNIQDLIFEKFNSYEEENSLKNIFIFFLGFFLLFLIIFINKNLKIRRKKKISEKKKKVMNFKKINNDVLKETQREKGVKI